MYRVNKHIVRKSLVTVLMLLASVGLPAVVAPAVTYAGAVTVCPDGQTTVPKGQEANCPKPAQPDKGITGGNCADTATGQVTSNCDLVKKFIQPFIDFLAAFVGVAVVISIIIGGIQYGSSAGDPQKVTMAKNRIRNSIIALITFIFLLSLLNFLIPGGLL